MSKNKKQPPVEDIRRIVAVCGLLLCLQDYVDEVRTSNVITDSGLRNTLRNLNRQLEERINRIYFGNRYISPEAELNFYELVELLRNHTDKFLSELLNLPKDDNPFENQ